MWIIVKEGYKVFLFKNVKYAVTGGKTGDNPVRNGGGEVGIGG